MLNNMSWTGYFTALGIALVIYYLFVGIKYYSEEIKDLFSGKRRISFNPALPGRNKRQRDEEPEHKEQAIAGFEHTTNDDFIVLERLIERLKKVINEAAGRKMILQEFKQYLTMILKDYPSVAGSHLRSSVNELIISECQKYGTVELNVKEVDMLWGE